MPLKSLEIFSTFLVAMLTLVVQAGRLSRNLHCIAKAGKLTQLPSSLHRTHRMQLNAFSFSYCSQAFNPLIMWFGFSAPIGSHDFYTHVQANTILSQ